MDLEGVREWVRAAERARDEVYPLLEVDREFGEILLDERQREVYRRRRILYEVQEATRRVAGERPEMILVTYDAAGDRYECRLFYKQAGAVRGLERFSVAARLEDVLEFGSHADPNVRLASEKIGEFHALRLRRAEEGEIAPSRRVFYASEL
ncbi:hypothetical protein E0L93_00310 [Rubrobacter taiwanensis]|uniref:Uncharacterized protein n=1 Tax=Rubrobacter taiwanensis TaxID=185139 RepID=A0A4R1BSA8_9ACTN|nr:hypothetical protein [Rubrobacter taiwanensis]TCJ20709.1 hypothetical protein E0L93_00310 [Rubrobacter taiwanensis]